MSAIGTEAWWLAATDPAPMLDWLRQTENLSERKARLFGCGCLRRVWGHLTDERSRRAIEIAERVADGEARQQERTSARALALKAAGAGSHEEWAAQRLLTRRAADCLTVPAETSQHLNGVPDAVVHAIGREAMAEVWRKGGHCPPEKLSEAEARERSAQATLLRHIIGNPFRPFFVPLDLPSVIFQLAEALYKGTDCAPALHDALLEAALPDLADHFHDPDHPKGCAWLDAILGKC